MLGGGVTCIGLESFGWSISVPARSTAAAIELLPTSRSIPPSWAALETERAIALADVVASATTCIATRCAWRRRPRCRTPYGVPATGTEETLARVDVNAIRRWHAESALSSSSVIALVGDLDPDELAAIAARAFSDVRHAPPPALPAPGWPPTITTSVETRDRAQTALAMLFQGPSRTDDARFSAEMIATVASGLGGRFFDELRDKRSLCYTVQRSRPSAGSRACSARTSPRRPSRRRGARRAARGFARAMNRSPPMNWRARTYAIGTHAIRQQSGGAVLADMVDAFLFGSLRELGEYEAKIRAVTPESMRAVAESFFDQSLRVEGIVRGKAP